jgi:TolB-like protein
MDFDEAKRILAVLEAQGVRYVLVGSMAMAAQDRVDAEALRQHFRLEED